MKRFLKTLVLLVVGLFFLVSGVNAALDRLAHSATQGSLGVYNEKGIVMLTYNGDLNYCKVFAKPNPVVALNFLHRT